jgi:hypothetical protein
MVPAVRGCARSSSISNQPARFGIGPEFLKKTKRKAAHDQSLALLRAAMLSRLVGFGSDFAAKHTALAATTTAAVYSAIASTCATTPSTASAARCRTGSLTLFVSRWRL